MSAEEIRRFLRPGMEKVEALIRESLATDIGLLDATNMKLREHPGKMMRPALAILSAEACGGVNEDTIRFAAASELLHNATLLHDDVVDGATERRGMPTVATLLSSPAAVLIGDFWLTRCMQAILDASRFSERVLRVFAATLSNLAEGELLQMEKSSMADTTQKDYLRIIYCKTASLFEASAEAAAISVEAAPEHLEAVKSYARKLGIAFQIKDDILDYLPSPGALGKPVGLDLKEQKITQPLLCAFESVPGMESSVREMVSHLADDSAMADKVRRFVTENGGTQKAGEVMDSYICGAVESLSALPASKAKEALAELASYVAKRDR